MKTLLLNKEEVRSLASMKATIAAVEEGYKAFDKGEVLQPDYIGIPFAAPRGEIDFKGGYYSGNNTVSMKASSGGFSENVKKYGLPSGMGTISVFDGQTCALLCIMDGSLITGLRTGAAGAVSAKVLARKDAKVVSVIGTGNQGRMQIRALREVMKIAEIHAYSRTPASTEAFKKDIEAECKMPVIIEKTKQAAVECADILVTTTRGKGEVVNAAWVKPGTHIIAIGTDMRGKQELDPEIFRHAKVVNDSIDQCTTKGETFVAIDKGVIKKSDVYGEIGEILLGKKAGRTDDKEITIFDSTGMAIQDNVTAYAIYKGALEKHVGTYYAFFA